MDRIRLILVTSFLVLAFCFQAQAHGRGACYIRVQYVFIGGVDQDEATQTACFENYTYQMCLDKAANTNWGIGVLSANVIALGLNQRCVDID